MKRKKDVLLVDSGNALYRHAVLSEGAKGEGERARADLVVSTMGRLGYDALAVGERDLVGGVDALRSAAEKARLELLSANLVDAKGKPVFAPSRVVKVGTVEVGLVGLSTADPNVDEAKAYLRAGLTATEPAAAARAAADALPADVDLVVVLGRLKPYEATRVAAAVPRARLFLTSGDGRFTHSGRAMGNALAYEGGSRGQVLLQLDVVLTGKGPLVDGELGQRGPGELEGMYAERKRLEKQMETAPADGPFRQRLLLSVARLDARIAEARRATSRTDSGGRVTVTPVMLGELVKDAKDVAREVKRVPPMPKN